MKVLGTSAYGQSPRAYLKMTEASHGLLADPGEGASRPIQSGFLVQIYHLGLPSAPAGLLVYARRPVLHTTG